MRKINRIFSTLVSSLIILGASTNILQAEIIRCGSRLVQTGDTQSTVRGICGKPYFKNTISVKESDNLNSLIENRSLRKKIAAYFKRLNIRKTSRRRGNSTLKIEQWTYHLGKGRFEKILSFRAAELIDIEDGRRL